MRGAARSGSLGRGRAVGASVAAVVPPVGSPKRAGWWQRLKRYVGIDDQALPLLLTAACGGFLVLGWVGEHTRAAAPLVLSLYATSYVAGAWEPSQVVFAELRRRELNIDFLMLLAAFGAAVVGAYWEGAVLLFLFSLGNALEEYAIGRSRRSIRALMDLKPRTATLLDSGKEREVPSTELRPGDAILVRPGDRLPVDGEVIRGSAHVETAAITGESVPVSVEPGVAVLAGAINLDGSLTIRVTTAEAESTLARIIQLVQQAQEAKAPVQRLIDRYEPIYALAVLGVAALSFGVSMAGNATVGEAMLRAMTLLVVASPCAIVISIPATALAAISRAARDGILFKGSRHFGRTMEAAVIAFDKTGTLTTGELSVSRVMAFRGADSEVLRLAASAERDSEHHVARAIVRRASREGLPLKRPDHFTAIPGRGVRATLSGHRVRVGNRAFLDAEGLRLKSEDEATLDCLEREGKSVVLVAEDGQVLGGIVIADELRDDAAAVVRRLRGLGLRTVLISGDNRWTAARVAEACGVDEHLAELDPERKTEAVAELRRRHGAVVMVGDGINDAPALATADVGIAMGAAGTDQALEVADVVLMGDDLWGVPRAVELSRRVQRTIRQNLIFAGGVIAVLVAGALLGGISLPLGVVGHEGSTVIVALNGLRLLR